jgi:membrane protease subunit HflK
MAWNESGNGKNPWNNKKPEGEGPPDLEEILKKWKEKLSHFFKSKNSEKKWQGQSEQSSNEGNENHQSLWFIVIIALLIWSLFGFYIVQPAEQGVETRFGEYTTTTNQGLNWYIPYPIEKVEKVNVEQIRTATHKAIMLTKDENIVEIELIVQYRVGEAGDYLFNVQDPDDTLLQATESALREVVGTSEMDKVLTSGRDEISIRTKALIQDILNRYRVGLEVISVNMQNAQPPEAVQSAFEDVIKAREDEERHKNKAQAYANEIKQRAGGTSDRLREEALAYKSQIVERAKGETQRFISILREYEKAPDIMRQRLYLDTMESVLSNTSKILVDVRENNNILLLPLDKLLHAKEPPISAPVVQSTDSTKNSPIPQNLPSERSRDDARNRGTR